MSNIKSELVTTKTKQKSSFDEDSAVKHVLLLENRETQEDLRIAMALGSHHNIARAQDKKGKMLELEHLDEKYVGNVFTLEQIRKLAEKYDMRFLQSKYYCGEIDLEVISKLKQFSKDAGVEINDANLKYNFYILAPETCFHLNTVVKLKNPPDPAMFYKIDNDHYRLIHQWGADFNIFNRIKGLLWKNETTRLVLHGILAAILSFTAIRFAFVKTDSIVLQVLSIVFTLGCIFYSGNTTFCKENEKKYHKQKWNNNDRTIYV